MRKAKSCSRSSDKEQTRFSCQYGHLGGASERVGGAGEALPGAQGGSGAFGRETRSVDNSDGGRTCRNGCSRRLPEADFPGVERARGAKRQGKIEGRLRNITVRQASHRATAKKDAIIHTGYRDLVVSGQRHRNTVVILGV